MYRNVWARSYFPTKILAMKMQLQKCFNTCSRQQNLHWKAVHDFHGMEGKNSWDNQDLPLHKIVARSTVIPSQWNWSSLWCSITLLCTLINILFAVLYNIKQCKQHQTWIFETFKMKCCNQEHARVPMYLCSWVKFWRAWRIPVIWAAFKWAGRKPFIHVEWGCAIVLFELHFHQPNKIIFIE